MLLRETSRILELLAINSFGNPFVQAAFFNTVKGNLTALFEIPDRLSVTLLVQSSIQDCITHNHYCYMSGY
jgi:hypothetical protein